VAVKKMHNFKVFSDFGSISEDEHLLLQNCSTNSLVKIVQNY